MSEKSVISKSSKTADKKKKPIAAAIIAVIILAIVMVTSFSGPTLNKSEQLAYQNAVKMKSMMRDPDSFKLYDQMFLIEKLDENGNVEYTYTLFTYGGTNGYGGVTTNQAVFKDSKYLMNYGDDIDSTDPNFNEKFMASGDLLMYSFPGNSDQYRTINIDIEKIKDKMGLK